MFTTTLTGPSKLPKLSTAVSGHVRLLTTPVTGPSCKQHQQQSTVMFITTLTGPSIQSTVNSHVHSTTDWSKLQTMSTAAAVDNHVHYHTDWSKYAVNT